MNEARQIAQHDQPGLGASWMLTFADLLSLLLTFFVLIFSMNTVELERWKTVVDAMTDQFNPKRPTVVLEQAPPPETALTDTEQGLNLVYLTNVLNRSFERSDLLKDLPIYRVRDTIVISIPANLLFARKQAALDDRALAMLSELTGVIVQLQNRIVVAGHTDQVPVSNNLFRSNWELSLARARMVAGVFADAGYRQPMIVKAYADTKYHQLRSDIPDQRRYELAERIDIIILNEKRGRGTYDLF